ncbi:MAG: hypothetical protein JKY27_09140 [Magnetovibrio sp.]|nr:hypothetical protein [Magnetovibrio sp.]
MSDTHKTISVRVTNDDFILHKQAAAQKDQAISAWMRESLRETALNQVYGEGEANAFPNTPSETALMRAVLVILQTVGVDTSDETKRQYAEKAARQIEKIKAEG